MGINFEHGIDFAEYTGYWPMPEACGGVIKILDDNNNPHVLVLDYRDGHFYDITTRDGPTGSYIENEFKDKVNIDGTGGFDIAPEVTFKEDTGEYEKFITEHHASHFYLRPNKESDGFPEGIEFTSSICADGNTTDEIAISEDINKSGEVVYDSKVEGNRLQTILSANMSGFKLVGRQQEYITKDILYSPETRRTTENDEQNSIVSNKIRWYTRGENPLKCRITNTKVSVSGITYTTGPDSKQNSAMVIPTSRDFVINTSGLIGDHTLLFWASGTFSVVNGMSVVTPTAQTNNVGWNCYSVTITPSDVPNLWIHATTATKLFDISLYSGVVTNFDYYIKDITKNNGYNVCPLF